MFSSSATPGVIFVPPAEHDPIVVDDAPETCVWTPGSAKEFIQRLAVISQVMSGNKGDRIKRLVQVVVNVGYSDARDLWYYNPGVINEYVASGLSALPNTYETDNARRREMTKATTGVFPFKGDTGANGEWQMHLIADLLDDFACRFDAAQVKKRLEWIDEQMYMGWHYMELASAQSSQGGGTGFGDMVWDFINSVGVYSKDPRNLYWAFSD